MQLMDLFDHSLVARARQEGLEFGGSALTFGELDRMSHGLALALAARGVAAGDRVCVYLPNSPGVIALFLACQKLGAIYVPVNILYRERELEHIRRDAEPKLFVDQALLHELQGAQAGAAADRIRVRIGGDAPAMIVYTSGTTGASKGAVITHNNMLANTANIVTCWEISAADRFLLALPLFHVHGLGNGIHAWLATGCRMRLLERFEHHRAAEEFLSFRPTLFFGVPTIYVRLLEAPAEIAAPMRLFVSGSAPLPAAVLVVGWYLGAHRPTEKLADDIAAATKGTTDEGTGEALHSSRGCMAWMCDRRWSDDLAIDRIGEGDSVRGS